MINVNDLVELARTPSFSSRKNKFITESSLKELYSKYQNNEARTFISGTNKYPDLDTVTELK